MTADEIKRLGDREIIVASGSPPVLTDKVKYYENGFFLKKLVDAPVSSDLIRSNPYLERDRLLAAVAEEKRQKEKAKEFSYEYQEP